MRVSRKVAAVVVGAGIGWSAGLWLDVPARLHEQPEAKPRAFHWTPGYAMPPAVDTATVLHMPEISGGADVVSASPAEITFSTAQGMSSGGTSIIATVDTCTRCGRGLPSSLGGLGKIKLFSAPDGRGFFARCFFDGCMLCLEADLARVSSRS